MKISEKDLATRAVLKGWGELTRLNKDFTRAGNFERKQFPEIPPRVEYHLTDFGKKFLRLIKEVEKLQADLDKAGH